MDNINCFKIALSNMVGNYVILRHLTSARGAELNGKRGKVVGHDQLHFPRPPRIHVAIPGEGTLKLKLRNLAEPSSFVDEPSHTRLPNERLIPLIEKLLRESSYEDSDRKDTKARLDWLQARLAEGGSIPAVPCMDLMLPEQTLQDDEYLGGMAAIRPCCCGDNTANLHRFAEGFIGDGSTCAICLEAIVPTAAALGLPCTHIFHRACLGQWLSRHNSCPTCKLTLPRLPGDEAPYSLDSEEQLFVRLKEWTISGMCERCQMSYHEKNPMATVPV